ncbi:MAG: DUF4440 domain-containing protein [Woeseiaceae bacterium]
MNLISRVFAPMALLLMSCTTVADTMETTSVEAEVRAMLSKQIADWNNGDIDAFMQSYWNNPTVRFASGGDVKSGWLTVLNQYKARYPDVSAMGRLTTAELDIQALSDSAALAFGRWIVTANGQDYCGLFSLVIRNVDDRWVIVHDHTSDSGGKMADGRTCSEIKEGS